MKIVIIEKDVHSLDRLTKFLEESFCNITVIRHANTMRNGVELINEVNPDIVFICFFQKDGGAFDILKKVSHVHFRIFFTVALNEPLNLLSDYYPKSNLLTPSNRKKKLTEINPYKAEQFKKVIPGHPIDPNARMLLPVGGAHIAIKADDIIKCVAEGNYTSFFLKDKKRLVTYPIKYYDSLLRDKGFFRINRSVLINISHITAIYKNETIVLTNNEKIRVSRRNKNNLKRLIAHLS